MRRLLVFSLPMLAGNFLQQLYQLADALIVGRFLGAEALAAVGVSYTFLVFLTSLLIGLCMGSGALLSADYGGGNLARLRQDARLAFGFLVVVTLALYGAVYPGLPALLKLLQTPPELMTLTRAYVSVVLMGLLFVSLYNFAAYLLRAVGDTVTPLFFLGGASLLNLGLDLWFVAGVGLGVEGAAWATVVAQGLSGLGLMGYAVRKLSWLVALVQPGEDGENPAPGARLRLLVATAVATGLQQSVMNFGILMIQGLVNRFGTAVMAGFAAAVKLDTLAYLPAQEFGNAYSLFVSQNHGAGQTQRIQTATRLAFGVSLGFCLLISCVVFCFSPALMGLFLEPGEAAFAEGVRYLRIEGAAYVGIGALFLWYGYFRGIGKPQLSLLLTVLSLGTRVLLSYTLAPHTSLGVTAIWLSIPIGWALADGVGVYLWRRGEAGGS